MPELLAAAAFAVPELLGGAAEAGAGLASGIGEAALGGLGELGGAAAGGLGELGAGLGGLAGAGEAALGGLGEALGFAGEAGAAGSAEAGGLGAIEAAAPSLGGAAPAAGAGASTFAAPAGVAGATDLTSAGGLTGTFGESVAATQEAIGAGVFDPVGSNFTSFGASAAPGAGAGDVFGIPATAAAPGVDLPTAATSTLGGPVPGAEGAFGGATAGSGAEGALTGHLVPDAAFANPSPAAGTSFLDSLSPGNLAKSAVGQIAKNPLGTALGVGGLAYNLAQGQAKPQGTDQIKRSADALAGQSEQLRSYLQSGTLPPGLSSAVDQANAAAKARVISNYASRNLPTDPSKNSALAQELASIDQQSVIQTAQIGQQLLTTGVNEAGLADNLYQALVGIDQKQSENVGKAIANFASALGGGGTKIQIGGSA